MQRHRDSQDDRFTEATTTWDWPTKETSHTAGGLYCPPKSELLTLLGEGRLRGLCKRLSIRGTRWQRSTVLVH